MDQESTGLKNVYLGIAGWSYPDWKGIVYSEPKADQLKFVSRFVDCIEINSTFYRAPDKKNSRAWLDKTSHKKGFFFTAKLHRQFTHEGKINTKMVRQFHRGFEPLLEAGKLRQLLIQFRYDFADTKDNRRYLAELVNIFSESFDIAVELRHISWESPDALKFMEQLGVAVCNLDCPIGGNSFNLYDGAVGRRGYLRLHGRNSEKWFSREAGRDETYDYYYNDNELAQIKSRIEKLAAACKYLTVIANNHYRGAELANSLELKYLLTGRKQQVPEGLLRTWPQLSKIAMNEPPKTLF